MAKKSYSIIMKIHLEILLGFIMMEGQSKAIEFSSKKYTMIIKMSFKTWDKTKWSQTAKFRRTKWRLMTYKALSTSSKSKRRKQSRISQQ